jgi:hypothetical protein
METQSPRVMGVKNKDINKTNSQHRSLTASPSRSFPAAVLSLTAQQFILHYPDGRKLKTKTESKAKWILKEHKEL